MLVLDPQKMLEEEGLECLTPDLPDAVIADINSSPTLQAYKDELVRGARVEAELALLRQVRIKEASDRIERCYMDGIGKRVASIDKVLFDRLCQVWGRKWFRDPDRLHRVLEENPQLAVKCRGWRNPSFRVDGFRDQRKAESGNAETLKLDECQNQERDGVKNGSAGHAAAGDPPRSFYGENADARSRPESSDHEIAGAPFSTDSRRPEERDAPPTCRKPWAVDVMSAMEGCPP